MLGGPNWAWAHVVYLCPVQKSEDEPNFSTWNGEVSRECSWSGNSVCDEVEITFPQGRKWRELLETLQEGQQGWHAQVKSAEDDVKESSSCRAQQTMLKIWGISLRAMVKVFLFLFIEV